jgi:hypothetical protein
MIAAEARFYVTGGTLPHDVPSYIERQADSDLYGGLSRGEFCHVLTSRPGTRAEGVGAASPP